LKSFQKWLLLTLQNGRKHEPQKAHKGFVTWRFGFFFYNEQIEVFLHEMSRKIINTVKVLSFNWLKKQKLKEVRKTLNQQKLQMFLEMSGHINPYTVKVFYTSISFEGENISSHVSKVWTWKSLLLYGLRSMD